MNSVCDIPQDPSEREEGNRSAFGALSGSYDTQINPLLTLEERYLDRVLPRIAGLGVLDAGCGSGRWLSKLAPLEPGTLIGIDPSDEMLRVASQKNIAGAELIRCRCEATPFRAQRFELILSSFVMSYIYDVLRMAREIDRIARVGCTLFISDMHPETQRRLGWKRAFHHGMGEIRLEPFMHDVHEIIAAFRELGWTICAAIEPEFGAAEKQLFERAGRLNNFLDAENHPAIYILHLQKAGSAVHNLPREGKTTLRGARCALDVTESVHASLRLVEGRVSQILGNRSEVPDPEIWSGSSRRQTDPLPQSEELGDAS